MLRLRMHSADLGGTWRTGPNHTAAAGASRLAPFAHPALHVDHHHASGRFELVVRETRPGGDHLQVVVTHGQARFTAGPGGVAPLYLAVVDGELVGSWDITELRSYGACARFDPLVATRILCRRRRCSARTLFAGVHRLTERSTATFDGATITTRYPQPHQHVLVARRLRTDADPVDYLDRALAALVEPIVEAHGDRVAVEVSGGLDSANIALTAAGTAQVPLRSYGLLVTGEIGAAQRDRRAEIVDLLGLQDTTTPAAGHLPFGDPTMRGVAHPHDPDGDVYAEACAAMYRAAAADGVAVVLTGFGGDEMLSPHERNAAATPPAPPTWLGDHARQLLVDIDNDTAPVAPNSLATQRTLTAHNPPYLRHGLWPIAPLADPGLYELGRSLPMEWRADKALLRRRAARAGLMLVASRGPQESFEPVMDRALRLHGPAMLVRMLDRSLLVDAGLVTRAGVEQLHRGLVMGRPVPPSAYDLMALEIGLQSMCGPVRVTR